MDNICDLTTTNTDCVKSLIELVIRVIPFSSAVSTLPINLSGYPLKGCYLLYYIYYIYTFANANIAKNIATTQHKKENVKTQ